MMPVAGRPFLDYLLRSLHRQGIERVVLCVGYGADRIREHFGSGQRVGLELAYSVESDLLGTGGALKLASETLGEEVFFALNGDSFAEVNLADLLAAHRSREARMTLALVQVPDASRFGVVDWEESTGRIRGFSEKGRGGAGVINGGVYVMNRDVAREIPAGVVSLEYQVLPRLVGTGAYGVVTSGLFVDIGLPEEYRRLAEHPGRFLSAVEGVAA